MPAVLTKPERRSVPMPKTRERQMKLARSKRMDTRVNEAAGDLRSELQLDPLLDANLQRKRGPMYHKDRDFVAWLKRNHPEVAPRVHADRISVGYSGGEGYGRAANRFGRIKERYIPGRGWVSA